MIHGRNRFAIHRVWALAAAVLCCVFPWSSVGAQGFASYYDGVKSVITPPASIRGSDWSVAKPAANGGLFSASKTVPVSGPFGQRTAATMVGTARGAALLGNLAKAAPYIGMAYVGYDFLERGGYLHEAGLVRVKVPVPPATVRTPHDGPIICYDWRPDGSKGGLCAPEATHQWICAAWAAQAVDPFYAECDGPRQVGFKRHKSFLDPSYSGPWKSWQEGFWPAWYPAGPVDSLQCADGYVSNDGGKSCIVQGRDGTKAGWSEPMSPQQAYDHMSPKDKQFFDSIGADTARAILQVGGDVTIESWGRGDPSPVSGQPQTSAAADGTVTTRQPYAIPLSDAHAGDPSRPTPVLPGAAPVRDAARITWIDSTITVSKKPDGSIVYYGPAGDTWPSDKPLPWDAPGARPGSTPFPLPATNAGTGSVPGTDAGTETPTQVDPCEAHPDRVGCMEVGDIPEADGIPHITKQVDFAAEDVGLPAACPADIRAGDYTVTFASACDYARKINPFLVGCAFIVGLLMCVGVMRM